MYHAARLNKIIEIARRTSSFEPIIYQPRISQDPAKLKEIFDTKNYFLTSSVLGMEAISHVIEDFAINNTSPFRFYTGCQKLSRLKPQKARYKKLCGLGNPISIFGIEDEPFWDFANLHAIPLDQPNLYDKDALALNWFVIHYNPKSVSMALVAKELPQPMLSYDLPDKNIYRNYEGFWTYNQTIIEEVVNILDDYSSRYTFTHLNDATGK